MSILVFVSICLCETQVFISNDAKKIVYIMDHPENSRIDALGMMPKINLVIENANLSNLVAVNGSAAYFVNTNWIDPEMKTRFCRFFNMTASLNGGAIYFGITSNVSIENSNFIFNKANKGGAVYMEQSKNLTVAESYFQEDFAENGGGLFLVKMDKIDLINTKFDSCTALSRGGGLFSELIYLGFSILGCLFSSCTSQSSSGGAIYAALETQYTTIQDCIFYNCSAISCGSAFISSNSFPSSIVLKNICGNSCFAYSSLHFLYVNINSLSPNTVTIQFNLSSISYCSKTTDRSYNTYFNNGNILSENLNISHNKASYVSGIMFRPKYESSLAFSTIVNNKVLNNQIIYIDGSSGLMNKIDYCNIMLNNSPEISNGIIHVIGKSSNSNGTIISNTIFFGNHHTLISISYGFHLIKDCHIVHNFLSYSFTKIISGSISTQRVLSDITGTPTYTLYHLNTFFCPTILSFIELEVPPCQTLPLYIMCSTNTIFSSKFVPIFVGSSTIIMVSI